MKWFIPGNVPSSKNGKRWTGKYLISSKTVMKYRKDTTNAYKKQVAVISLITLILHKQCKMIWLNMDGLKMII